jgi:hypothetical protein
MTSTFSTQPTLFRKAGSPHSRSLKIPPHVFSPFNTFTKLSKFSKVFCAARGLDIHAFFDYLSGASKRSCAIIPTNKTTPAPKPEYV